MKGCHYIECKGLKQIDKAMAKLRASGCTWGSGNKLSSFKFRDDSHIYLFVEDYKVLFGYKNCTDLSLYSNYKKLNFNSIKFKLK